jgi:hypothetical protein
MLIFSIYKRKIKTNIGLILYILEGLEFDSHAMKVQNVRKSDPER